MTKTPRQMKVDIKEVDFSIIPQWSKEQLDEAFARVRDEAFFKHNRKNRRVPWYYVENGCFARAAIIRKQFSKWGYPRIKKLFIFGQMKFQFNYLFKQTITFRDHVACTARVGDEVYVIDPPMCFERVLSLNEWINKLFELSTNKDFKLFVSSEFTLSHNGDVNAASEKDEVGMKKGKMRELEYFVEEMMIKEEEVLSLNNLDLEILYTDKLSF